MAGMHGVGGGVQEGAFAFHDLEITMKEKISL